MRYKFLPALHISCIYFLLKIDTSGPSNVKLRIKVLPNNADAVKEKDFVFIVRSTLSMMFFGCTSMKNKNHKI